MNNDEDLVTIDQLSNQIKEAQEIIRCFVKDFFGEEVLQKVEKIFDEYNFEIDYDEPEDDEPIRTCMYNDFNNKTIYLKETYCKKAMDDISIIGNIIHEYAHSFSRFLSKGNVNDVVEEAFADLFSEICINYYKNKGKKITSVSKGIDNNEKYKQRTSYKDHGIFLRSIIYALGDEEKDTEAIGYYLFKSKKSFVDICEEIFGYKIREVLIRDLEKVVIKYSVNGFKENTNEYLPDATRKLRNILIEHFYKYMDEDDIKQPRKEEIRELYSIEDNSIIDSIVEENKIRDKILKESGFSEFSEDNILQIFSKINLESICFKLDIDLEQLCSEWGYSNFIKSVFRALYRSDKEKLLEFENLMRLTGGIPFEIFQEIISDKRITDIKDILYFLDYYQVLNDKESYSSILKLLNQKIGNEFDKEKYDELMRIKPMDFCRLSTYMTEVLANFDISNEEMQRILYIYNNSKEMIGLEKKLEAVEVFENNISKLPKDLYTFTMFGYHLKKDLLGYGDYDLELLSKITKILNIRCKLFKPDIQTIESEVKRAIDALRMYGFEIENEEQIMDCIKNYKYEDIKIKPRINTVALEAFSMKPQETKIIRNLCINQFLNDDDPNFLNNSENVAVCLMLLDPKNHSWFGMSYSVSRVCAIIRKKLESAKEINPDDRKMLEDELYNREKEENMRPLELFLWNVNNDERVPIKLRQKILEPVIKFFKKQNLNSDQVKDMLFFMKCVKAQFFRTFLKDDELLEFTKKNEPDLFECEYNLENINSVLAIFENVDISCESESLDRGQELLIYKLMNGAKSVPINDENIGLLRQIYQKLKTINGLSEQDIRKELLANDEIANMVCGCKSLKENAVIATLNVTIPEILNVNEQIASENVLKEDNGSYFNETKV